MKVTFVALALAFLTAPLFAQNNGTYKVGKRTTVKIDVTADSTKADTVKKPSSKFSIQLTLARLDLGLAKFTDNGSFTLSAPNQYLETETWKTHNAGFEFFQMGYRFNPYFKVYLATGIDWVHMRLKQNFTFKADAPEIDTINSTIDYKKNRFSSTYLRVPLSIQLRTKDDNKGNKVYFVFGPEVGFLINGKQKLVSKEKGKEKLKDDFNLNPFRYGAFARLGYDDFGVYIKYYNNDVFADNQGPKGFKNMNFGVTVGF